MTTPTTSTTFEALRKFQYASLTTYRKSGVGVPTPVWFALENGKIYGTTQIQAGKIKRIRNNPRVSLAPCTVSGGILGDSIEGMARELPAAERGKAEAALRKKYGLQYILLTTMMKLRGGKSTFWEVSPL